MIAKMLIFAVSVLLISGSAMGQNKYEMRFQFDHNGFPSIHTFLLKWPAPDANLQTIDVLISDSQEVIQTIQVPQDGTKLVYEELTDRPGTVKEKFIDSLDYNFDKFADLRLMKNWPFQPGKKYYYVWLFDEDKNEYVMSEAISALPGPVPDPKTRRIISTELGGYGGGEYTTRHYSINATGRLKVQTRIIQSLHTQSRHTFKREIRVRIAGELQKVCSLIIPAEGKPQRMWGRKWWCDKFTEKD